ncbi:MAG: AbrB/MazE/SpoVT family DNA-binding domain-containing protein [Gemmatimonadota bacterium]|nr:AbrB/MazE/SpoVT family DNA-binding domain-containing protein [Gemmatimonadota bacterium]
MTERGQVTIPKGIRERFGIRPGSEIEFQVEDGRIVLEKVTEGDPLDRLVGLIQERVDVDAYLEETRGPAFDPETDPEGPLDDEID